MSKFQKSMWLILAVLLIGTTVAYAGGLVMVADGRRNKVLLHPRGAVTIELEPATDALMWLAREDQIDVLTRLAGTGQGFG